MIQESEPGPSLLHNVDSVFEQSQEIDQIVKNTDVWALNTSRFTSQWRALFHSLTKVETEQLWLDDNNHETIISDLLNINFITLKFLCLSKNRIRSVEGLVWLRANLLQEINLDSNNIITVKSMRRCDFPSLEYISIADNPVRDVECLYQLNCRLCRLDLQYEDSEVLGENINWICKLSCTSLERIYIESSKRIKNSKVTSILQHRFPSIDIYDHDN